MCRTVDEVDSLFFNVCEINWADQGTDDVMVASVLSVKVVAQQVEPYAHP